MAATAGTAFNPSPGGFRTIKVVLFLLALVPLARLVWAGFNDGLGANPIEFITRNTGDWTLYFLIFTLAVTPLRRLTKWNWLIKLRRMIGLYAFFYALLHFTTFFWFDHSFDIAAMWADVVKRPFITVGFAAFVLLIPLAATSANRMIRALGGKRWQALHRLVYAIAFLGALHYWWIKSAKNDIQQPLIYGGIIVALLLVRVYWAWQKRRDRPRAEGR
jgi:sulfoxide reductase heme-binding subunit YedZ